MKNILVVLAVLLLAAPARAIELSLEENRAERGSVGYVDMQRLFTASPDAQHAREGFEELVRQAEERVNLKKAELLKLRQELDSARLERDALSASTAAAAALPAADTAAAVAPPAAPPAAPAVDVATAAPASLVPGLTASTAPAAAPAAAPAPAPRPNLALPGMTSDTATIAPPEASTAAAPAPPAPAVAASTAAPAAPVSPQAAAGMFPAPPPAPAAAPAPAGPTPTQRLLELDGKIIRLQSEIEAKEGELTREHDDADHGLLDVESRKTDQVLARLYRALTAVARREGVSVVIDKSHILYGHPAVDLTDKVLKYLRENQQP